MHGPYLQKYRRCGFHGDRVRPIPENYHDEHPATVQSYRPLQVQQHVCRSFARMLSALPDAEYMFSYRNLDIWTETVSIITTIQISACHSLLASMASPFT